ILRQRVRQSRHRRKERRTQLRLRVIPRRLQTLLSTRQGVRLPRKSPLRCRRLVIQQRQRRLSLRLVVRGTRQIRQTHLSKLRLDTGVVDRDTVSFDRVTLTTQQGRQRGHRIRRRPAELSSKVSSQPDKLIRLRRNLIKRHTK